MWCECPHSGAQAAPQSWRWPLEENRRDRGHEARIPGLKQLPSIVHMVSGFPGTRGVCWAVALLSPTAPIPQPVNWVKAPRAQIPQCLGWDYPADPTCHHMCGQPGPLWMACPVPSIRDAWLQSEQLSLIPAPVSPWPQSLGVFICGTQEAPAIWKVPEEHRFYGPGGGPGSGPGSAGLRRVVLEPGPCCPPA